MRFTFHAAPPQNEWFNDPNGLVFIDGRYRLFTQHSASAPDYKEIGWSRLSSDDLLHWEWDGCVISPDESGLAYSGSVSAERGNLTVYLTRHNPLEQRQFRLSSVDSGKSWHQDIEQLGPHGRNVRDPFVFIHADSGNRMMLLAEPCDWHDWKQQRPSHLSVWCETAMNWERVGTIGPWSPRGIMWEVPVLVDFGTRHVLIISIVDRSHGTSQCSVRYWTGHFDGKCFLADDPTSGRLLDHGPDFYAVCANTIFGWPTADRVIVGWASSWATARLVAWPDHVQGGPISLPRKLSLYEHHLRQSPIDQAERLATLYVWTPGDCFEFTIHGDGTNFVLRIDETGTLEAKRSGSISMNWACHEPCFLTNLTTIKVFNDCGLLEFFFLTEGKTLTVFLPHSQNLTQA